MAITQPEIDALAGNNPLVASRNALEDNQNAAEWRNDGANKWTSGSNNTATGFDADRAHDGYQDAVTKPAVPGAGTGSRAFLLDLLTTLTNILPNESNEIDCAVVGGHNFSQCGGTVNAYLEYCEAGDGDFSPAHIAYEWLNIVNDKRLVGLNFGETATYVAANSRITKRYWRLRVTSASNFAGAEPQFGELFLAKRRQLSQHGDVPFRKVGMRSRQDKTPSKSGISTVYEYYQRRFVKPFRWRFPEGVISQLYGLDDGDNILRWYRDCGGGNKPFYYIEYPNTLPGEAYFCRMRSPDLEFEKLDNVLTRFETTLEEEGPFVDVEQAGTT